jgi:hypothetical protein
MEYYTERISKDNFSSFLSVFEMSFNIVIDESYFINKFNTDFTNYSVVGYIAFEKSTNEPAAFYGVYPAEVSYLEKKVIAAQSGDTGTHPNHRKKGLFKLLHDLTMETCKQEGIAFVFGFCYPTQASYYGFMKFNWSEQSVLSTLVRTNKTKLKSKLIRKLSPSIYNKMCSRIVDKKKSKVSKLQLENNLDALFYLNELEMTISRSSEYLEYKKSLGSIYLEFKSGIAWVSIINNKIEIGDLFGNEKEGVLNELIDFCETVGFQYLEIKCNNKNLQKLLLNKFDFKKSEKHYHLLINYLDPKYKSFNLICTGGDIDSFAI